MLKKCVELLIISCIAFAPEDAIASPQKTYGDLQNAQYVKNYDGDTVTFNLSGIHPIIGKNISVRVFGIDTPELRGKCQKEKDLARQAKRLVTSILKPAKTISLKDLQRGKYFRIVARIEADGQDLGAMVIKNGLAVEYFGGKKVKDWCG